MDSDGKSRLNFESFASSVDNILKGTGNLNIILDTIPSAIVLVDAGGKSVYVNKRAMDLYGINYSGFKMDEHISKVKAQKLGGEPYPLEEMPVNYSLKFGQVVRNAEMIIQNVSGIKYPVSVSSAPLHDSSDNISGAIVTFEDFTERKHAEEALKQSEEKYRKLFNSIDMGVFLIDVIFDENNNPVDMYYVEANAAATRIQGMDFTGKNLKDINENYESYWFEIFGRVALTGEPVQMEQYSGPDDKWYSFHLFKIGGEESRRIGNVFSDITERKLAEEALRLSEKRLAADLDAQIRIHKISTSFVSYDGFSLLMNEIIEAAVSVASADCGTLQLIKPRSESLEIVAQYGFDQSYLDFFSSVSHDNAAVCGAALGQRERVIVEDVTKSPIFKGSPALEVQLAAGVRAVQSTPLINLKGEIIGILSTHWKKPYYPDEHVLRYIDLLARQAADIIEHKKAEEALRESEYKFRTIIETAGEGVVMALPEGNYFFINQRMSEMLGYPVEEILGKSSVDFSYSERHPQVIRTRQELHRGEVIQGEFMFRRKDGSAL